MRFAVVAIAVAFLAAQPALSAPAVGSSLNGIVPSRTAGSPLSFQPLSVVRPPFPEIQLHPLVQREEFALFARELEELLARDGLDGSEAFSIPSIFKTLVKAVPTVFSLLGGGGSSQPQPTQTAAPTQRRDVEYLEARTSLSDLAHQIAEETRNSNHILYSNARAIQRSIDEGLALSSRDSIAKTALKLIPGVGGGIKSAIKAAEKIAPKVPKRPKRTSPLAREFMDVLARALEARELNELD